MKDDYKFWNNDDNVKYFEKKPADPRIVSYIETISDEKTSEMNALELGCGGGRHTEMLVRKGLKTFAVDVNPSMLEATRERVAQLATDNSPTIQEGSITAIPFPDNFFNIVVTTGVLHQARSQEEYKTAIAELSRVCKDNAVIELNIFTNRDIDPTYVFLDEDKTVVKTKEGLLMTLLPKQLFYDMMADQGFALDKEHIEELKQENTGPRTVLRARFIKA
jgi:ubiquinone/menaquinone biosynthesis C-methylase UbiE